MILNPVRMKRFYMQIKFLPKIFCLKNISVLRLAASILGLSFFSLTLTSTLTSCNSDPKTGPEQIQFDLADSLKNYSKVIITLVDSKDSTKVLDTAFSGKITDPKKVPLYTVPVKVGNKYRIRIQGFNDKGQLALQSDIAVNAGSAAAPTHLPPSQLPALIAQASSALLKSLEISSGNLIPHIDSAVFSYTVELPFATDSLAINAITMDSTSILTFQGQPIKSGSPSAQQGVVIGPNNSFQISVLPLGAKIPITYTIAITRKSGIEARLDSLIIAPGTFFPVFNSDSLNYSMTVPAEIETLTVRAVPKDRKSKMEFAVQSGAPWQSLDSAFGAIVVLKPNDTSSVIVKVTSPDTLIVKAYVIKVTHSPSSDAALKNLILSSGSVVPAFDPEITSYTATEGVDQITLTATSRAKGSGLKLGTTNLDNGLPSAPISISVGLTLDTITVTAPDGKSKRNYFIFLNRASPDAFLTNISGGTATFDSAFVGNRFHYASKVARTVDTLILTCAAPSGIKGVAVTVDSVIVKQFVTNIIIPNQTVFHVPLKVKTNSIAIQVTAPDGISKNTYSVDVLRTPNANADLSVFSLAPNPFKPNFNADSLSYSDSLKYVDSTNYLTVKVKDDNAKVVVRVYKTDLSLVSPPVLKSVPGTIVGPVILPPTPFFKQTLLSADTLISPKTLVTLKVPNGVGQITATVMAENDSTEKTYTIRTTRAFNNNSKLASLAVSAFGATASISPVFSEGNLLYNTTVVSAFVSVTVRSFDPLATMTVNGIIASVNSPTVPINNIFLGINTITVICTAPDGISKTTYLILVNRPL